MQVKLLLISVAGKFEGRKVDSRFYSAVANMEPGFTNLLANRKYLSLKFS